MVNVYPCKFFVRSNTREKNVVAYQALNFTGVQKSLLTIIVRTRREAWGQGCVVATQRSGLALFPGSTLYAWKDLHDKLSDSDLVIVFVDIWSVIKNRAIPV